MIEDAFEFSKNDERTINLAWLRSIPIVSYGYVSHVYTDTRVRVKPVVQKTNDFVAEYDVTLLSLTSDAFELHVSPAEKDLVLLFSLDRIHSEMFMPVNTRLYDDEGELIEYPEEEEAGLPIDRSVVVEDSARGYSACAMVGILASTVKHGSAFSMSVNEGMFTLSCAESFWSTFSDRFRMELRTPDGEDEEIGVVVMIGERRPTSVYSASNITITHGLIEEGSDDGPLLKPIESPIKILIGRESPVETVIGSPVDIKIGFNPDEEGEEEETESPVSIMTSTQAPVTAVIGAPADLKIGYDFEESDVDASVNIELSEESELNIVSGSSFSAEFAKTFDLLVKEAVKVVADQALEIVSKQAIELAVEGSGMLTIKNAVNSLGGILDEYNDILSNFDTAGSPASHMTGPAATARLAALKTIQGMVFD